MIRLGGTPQKKLPPAATGGKEDKEMRSGDNSSFHPSLSIPHQGPKVNPWKGRVRAGRISRARTPGNVRAYVEVEIGFNQDELTITILGCKVVQQPGQKAWVAMPDRQGESGQWFPCIRLDNKQLREEISSAVLSAWQQTMDTARAEQTDGGGEHGIVS